MRGRRAQADTLSKGASRRGGRRRVFVRQCDIGQVEELAPALVRCRIVESIAQALEDGRELRQATPSLDVHDARGTERCEVAHDHRVEVGARIDAAREPGLARHPARLASELPEPARGHLNRGTEQCGRLRERRRIDLRPVGARSAPSSGRVSAARREVLERGVGERIEVEIAQPCRRDSSEGCARDARISGRSSVQSRSLTRWTVQRISTPRTARRSATSAESSLGSKASRRDHRPMYGACGSCACMPTRCSSAAATGSCDRSSSNWRASRARPSARSLKRAISDLPALGDCAPPRAAPDA